MLQAAAAASTAATAASTKAGAKAELAVAASSKPGAVNTSSTLTTAASKPGPVESGKAPADALPVAAAAAAAAARQPGGEAAAANRGSKLAPDTASCKPEPREAVKVPSQQPPGAAAQSSPAADGTRKAPNMDVLLAAAASVKAEVAANRSSTKQLPAAAAALSNIGYVPPNRRSHAIPIKPPRTAAAAASSAGARRLLAHPLQAGSTAARGVKSSDKPASKVTSSTQTSTPPELLDQHYLREKYCSMKTFGADVVQVR
jgi:hypothetical protein